MKYEIMDPGIKEISPIGVDVISAKKAASTEYVLFALSCLNRALALLKWYTCSSKKKEKGKDKIKVKEERKRGAELLRKLNVKMQDIS